MPILAGGLATAPQIPEVPFVQPVWREDLGTITATWVDPDGTEWPLSIPDLGWFTANGPGGWGSTPLELIVDPLPRGGEQVRYIRSKPRRINWPIYIGSEPTGTHQDFTTNRRRITRAFTKTTQRGEPGWLRIARPDGRYRQIACYYEEGFEGQPGEDHLYAKPVIQLYCPDGFWSGDRPVVAERQFAPEDPDPDDLVTFYNPFMSVTSSLVVSGDDGEGVPSTTVTNDGDVEAWPVWTLDGPISSLTAVNLTTGARFTLDYTLDAGEQIVITTNRPTVRGPAGINLSKYIDWLNPLGTELWPLVDGANSISFVATGAGVGTKVVMAFTPRYETA